MMNIEISIIVAVYNLESYLPKCIDSILAQTFTNFELILVNDGSLDKSGEICDDYEKRDSRIRVIHKENGGVASSRNAGLEVAQGKYIGYVDNDDFINKYMFETLYKHAVLHSSDIVVCDFMRIDNEQYCNTEELVSDYDVQHFTGMEALEQLYTDDYVTLVVPWNKLYKREVLENITYEIGNLYDDETVVHKLLYNSKNITYIHTTFYYYLTRIGSQINSPFTIKRFGKVYALSDRVDYFNKHKLHHLHEKALKHYYEFFIWYYNTAATELIGVEKELKALKKTFNRRLLSLLKLKDLGWKEKCTSILFWVSPFLYKALMNSRVNKVKRQEI